MILLDTSGLLAAMDGSQRRHDDCKLALLSADPPYLLSPFVLAELDYLLAARVGIASELAFLEEVAREAYRLGVFSPADIGEAGQIVAKYRNLDIGVAKASLVVLSLRYDTLDVLTLDLRHFGVLRGARGKAFRILPGSPASS